MILVDFKNANVFRLSPIHSTSLEISSDVECMGLLPAMFGKR